MATRTTNRLPSLAIFFIGLFIALTGVSCGGGGGSPSYSIGGTVNGLTGTGMVLQNNAGDNLVVSADGGFTFASRLNSSVAYSVSIQTQPTNQNCSVSAGSGTVAAANITSVSVNCDQDAQGLYTTNGNGSGTFKNDDPTQADIVKTLTDIRGMIYGSLPNQKFIFFDLAANVLYAGNITSITLNDFVGTAVVYNDGVMVDNNVAVSGTVTTSSSIEMTLAANGEFVKGTIKGLFSTAYNNVATKARISSFAIKPWDSGGIGSLKIAIPDMNIPDFTVNADDTYKYSSTRTGAPGQCGHKGALTSDTPKNIYPLFDEKITAFTNCTISTLPVYTGFASVVAVNGTGGGATMWYAVTNGNNSIFAILTR